MKKIIVSGLLTSVLGLSVHAKSGWFLGGELGVGFVQKSTPAAGSLQYTYGADYGLHWGVKTGYLHHFEGASALRVYANYAQNHLWPILNGPDTGDNGFKTKRGTSFMADANLDYIYNLIKTDDKSAGIFLGGFLGYSQWNGTYYRRDGSQNLNLREERKGLGVGISTGVNIQVGHHSFDAIFKVPFYGPVATDAKTNNREKSWKNGYIGFSYAYVF